jgi:type I restriction enzyme S subunit
MDALLPDIPEGWVKAKIADIVQPVPNARPQDEPDREFGYVDISSIDNETFQIMHTKRFLGKDAPSRAKRPIKAGDVLFSNVRTYLRNISVVPADCDADLCSTGFTVLRSNGAVDPLFLFRYLLTDDFIDRITAMQTGTHYPATSDAAVLEQTVLVPPLPEQRRIAVQVDALLGRLARTHHRLSSVGATIRKLRQSVLAAACSGRLTEDWREKHPETESASIFVSKFALSRRAASPQPDGRVSRSDLDMYLFNKPGRAMMCSRTAPN